MVVVVVAVQEGAGVGAEARVAVEALDFGGAMASDVFRGFGESNRRGDRAGVDMLQGNPTLRERLGALLGGETREQRVHAGSSSST